ncbi:MAG: tetratricopeptide repeat protein [Acidobacteriia bacterium]|nr:tetratricopeptide repeat protein [Terriglobia bacterium]
MTIQRFILTVAALALTGLPAFAQATTAGKPKAVDKADAYYNFSMGHLYGELAGAYGNRSEYVNQAIDHYRQAMKADPGATFLAEELADIYIQSNRLREGVTDAEAALKDNPDDLNSRRILGRIYTRLIGDTQRGTVNEEMLKRATEQYSKVLEKEPNDIESWLVLGRLHKVAQNSIEAEKAFQKALDLDKESEEALTGMATVYADLGESRKASELLRKVAEKSPNLRTLMALAGAYEQMRDYSLAAETLRQANKLAPGNEELLRALGQNLMLADKLDDALKIYKELIAEEPKDVQSHLRISQIYRQQRKFAEARAASDEAKKLDASSLEVLYNEVGIFEAEGKFPQAIAALKNVLQSSAKKSYSPAEKNNRALLLERLGLLYRNHEQYKDAQETFRELSLLDPALGSRAAAQTIDTHRQAKEFQRALEEADAALKKWPDDRTIRVVRSSVLAELGRVEEAAADLRKMLDGKTDRETYLTLAQMYEKGKNYQEMGKAIDEAEKLSLSSDEKEVIHFMRGAMLEKMKKLDQSEAEFRKVLAMNPTSASALNYLGYMFADRGVRLNEALDMIQKALAQDPHNGAYLDSLGWVYYRLDRLPEAEEALRQALNTTATDPTINDHLGDVYAKKGSLKEAIQQWETSLKLWNASSPSELDSQEVAKVQKKLEGARVRLAKEQQRKP